MVTRFFRWAKLPPLICIFVTVMSWYACHHTINAVLNLYSHISARAGPAHIFHSSDFLLALRGKLPSSPSGIDFYSGCFEHCISLLCLSNLKMALYAFTTCHITSISQQGFYSTDTQLFLNNKEVTLNWCRKGYLMQFPFAVLLLQAVQKEVLI